MGVRVRYFDEEGKWLGPPEARIREFRMNYGTAQWNLRKAPTDNLPSSTLFIDLSKSIEFLLQRMKPKTRYNINLAQRKGVHVCGAGVESLSLWYELYIQTARRNRFLLNDLEYFKSLIEARKVCSNKDAKVIMLIAEVNGKALAGMFLVISGKRATYLYWASSDDCRNYMGSYALQWKAIQVAKAAGCTQYDMFGVPQIPDKSHPMYGLYRFKSGFGSRLYHRQGCWDYPLSESYYAGYRAAELTAEGYHLN